MGIPLSPLVAAALCLLIGCQILQVSGHMRSYELKYKPVIFDDQYIGCSELLSKDIMPGILRQEMSNQQFNKAWKDATKRWEKIRPRLVLPVGFEDEHGIALLVFTSQYPKGKPIHQQLNGNLTIAGASRQAYMDKFHFKALHYYLTRALQILKPDCRQTYITYRGSPDTFKVPPIFKFGRFTSTSLNSSQALYFGHHSRFNIITCFGTSIANFSYFPNELEVLIPPAEKFTYIKKEGSIHYLESTGQMCSYFNCAILGAEKRSGAICYPGSASTSPEEQEERRSALEEQEERIAALEEQEERIAALEELTIRIDDTFDRLMTQMHEYVTKVGLSDEKMEEFKKLVEEAANNLTLTKSVIKTHRTNSDNVYLILSNSIIQLQEKVLMMDAFLKKLTTIFWAVIVLFTAVAGMKIFTFMKKFVLALVGMPDMNGPLPGNPAPGNHVHGNHMPGNHVHGNHMPGNHVHGNHVPAPARN